MAANGKEAMAAYQEAVLEKNPYDLILLDIVMPEMDGNEVLREIRNRESVSTPGSFKKTLIAMASSLGDKKSVIGSFHDQCDGYIVKPYTPDSVIRDLKRCGIISDS
jgi:two-component system chemotaxis response regulator CheY